ncbi:MAG: AI-2E family transporter [Eubacteriales bacterium]|nr:AI-2E family transporter [Clostridiales bacterium]MDY5836290.1 AI-2E family transporter [Eubacteriales bacterium]
MSEKLDHMNKHTSLSKAKDPKALYRRILVRTIIAALVCLVVYYIVVPGLHIFSPLIWAALLATLLSPLLNKIYQYSKIPRGILSFIMVFLIIALLVVPSYFLVKVALDQVRDFAGALQRTSLFDLGDPETIEKIQSWIEDLPDPAAGYVQDLLNNLQRGMQSSANRMLNLSVTFGRRIISQATSIGLWLFTFFMSIFFILLDYEKIYQAISKKLTRPTRKTLEIVKSTGVVAVGKYVRGLFYLAVFCTVYMLIAFSIYGYPYAILLSLCMGVLDILPIVGSLTILVPWCALEFLIGDFHFASFLLITICIYTVLRKMVEPKLMGTATGLHPLFTLILFYVTLRYMGVWAAILAPILAMMLISIYQAGLFDEWLLDLYEFRSRLRVLLRRKG